MRASSPGRALGRSGAVSAALARRRASRHAARGQAIVEFALTIPLFALLVFGIIEGSLLLFSVNAIDHAASTGAHALAALGSDSNADTSALAAMRQAGLGQGGLTTVNEVDLYLLREDGSNQRDTTSCVTGTQPAGCFQRYTLAGTLIEGNWPPENRHISQFDSDYVELDVHYTYSYFTGPQPTLSLTAVRIFRLEPQT